MAISLYTYLRNETWATFSGIRLKHRPLRNCAGCTCTLSEQLRDQLQQIESDKQDLETQTLDRIANLESRNLELREQIRQVEADKRYIETQKIRYEREVRKLKSESEQTQEPAAHHRYHRGRGRCIPGHRQEQRRSEISRTELPEHQPG